MEFISTRDPNLRTGIEQALRAGLAPDGGLYVPERLPRLEPSAMNPEASLAECALDVLAPFFDGSRLAERLPAICREALNLPLPLVRLDNGPTWLMELFHGPTAAFKDFAARFLAGCLQALGRGSPITTVLVATSGDTGAAVAAAFHRRPGFRVVILYPDGRVAARQAHQLGAFGDNVHALRVAGDFDDCQRLVKQALADRDRVRRFGLTSANSISIGRLLPQISYYALAALRLREHAPIDVIVPTGNLGNALACILAREMGFGIGSVHLATNANRTLPDFFAGQDYAGRPGLKTLANAMDVGDPSNFERLAWLFRERDPRNAGIEASSYDDAAIEDTIRRVWRERGMAVCPHTACAMALAGHLREAGRDSPLLIAATAHPAKFDSVVEPLIGAPVEVPPALARLLARPSRSEPIAADDGALNSMLEHLDDA